MISLNATLIIQIINFLLLMWILNRILFKPILKMLEEREERISRHDKSTQNLQFQAHLTKEEYEQKMRQAQRLSAEEKEGIRRGGAEEAKRIVEGVAIDSGKSLAETREVIARGAEKARAEFERLGGEISLEIYRKIIGKQIE
jgi:F-type H+-transporting ATPase subunit b